MRLLDRYLLRELAVPLAYCLAGFFIFWVSFDLFSDLEEFQRENLTPLEITRYYLVKTPELLITVLPVALLLGLLYALTTHARHNEIVAMRAAGISLFRISIPYLAVGFAFSLLLLYLNESLVTKYTGAAERLRKKDQLTNDKQWVHNVNFRNARANRIWNIQSYNLVTSQMYMPQVEWPLPNGAQRKLFAKNAYRINDQWVFNDAEIFTYSPGIEFRKMARPLTTNQVVFPELEETPREIALYIKFHSMNVLDAAKRVQLTLDEIQYLRTHLELNPRDKALLETQFHARLAQPWTCIVVVLIALPFGTLTSRKNVFTGVAASIFICFTYFILLRFGLALGTGGILPAPLSAWLPNVLFAATGLWLTLRTR